MVERRLIACIDDDPFVLEALEDLLHSIGHPAIGFASAEEFLAFSGREDLACLITDMKLGGISGLQLLKKMAAEGWGIPSIVITAFGEELREQCLAAGAIGFLQKPIHDAELLALLKVALDRSTR